jgi:hypothetical protein
MNEAKRGWLGSRFAEPLKRRIVDAVALEPGDITLKYPEELYRGVNQPFEGMEEYDTRTAVQIKMIYAALMGRFVDRGEVFQILGDEISQLDLSAIEPLPLRGSIQELELSDMAVRYLIGQEPPQTYTARKQIQKELQTRLLRAANAWRTWERVNSIVISTNGQTFPATMQGIDQACEAQGFPDFTLNNGIVDVAHPKAEVTPQ